MKCITFKNREINIAGHLYLPNEFDESKQYAALILATPGSSVKEQIGGIYAKKLARAGFVTLTFDPSYQGESGGEPRDLEEPSTRVEDIRCAVDNLMTQSFIDEARIGLIGICAGGGYAVNAALTDHRIKAISTVVATDIGRAFRQIIPMNDRLTLLAEIGKQRTAEARGASQRRDPWIPDSLKGAEAAGIDDPATLEAVTFYRESQYCHPNSTNRLLFTSFGHLLGFDALHLVPEFLIQPLEVIVGGRRGSTGQYESGETLYSLSPTTDKSFFEVDGAGHYDLYYKAQYVDQVIGERLVPFFSKHLVK
ncbi:alpha/beta hydrolase [Marinomonas mediterranea]|uniref:alpha/beta hydrolase n=1 Tax=Marinomonas mediterranea TaxID=119864 RepID=UPI00234B7BAD|nr:alpha/beta hydrolase [Marinomonas mediterranea]WCN14092.1 alpha/beta hydrolase [Marinomonas mediterranea]